MKQLIDKSTVIAEIEKNKNEMEPERDWHFDEYTNGYLDALKQTLSFLDTIEVKEVDFERELGKYVSEGIHRFYPNEGDDYYNMDSVVWQDYIIETAEHFYELGLKTQKEE